MPSPDPRAAPAQAAPLHRSWPLEISVLIVNHNVKDFLLPCLRSLEVALRNVEGEVIVVDNRSTDGSVDFLAPLFPDVTFIPLPENLGFGRANNVALERARGEYVLFLNPDTLLEERTLEVMLDYMRRHPEVGMSGCRVLNPDGTFQLACRRGFPTPWRSFCKAFGLQALFPRVRLFAGYNQTFRSEHEAHPVDAVSGAFMFGRATALEKTGGFDPDFFMFGEDLDLCYRIAQAGWGIAYVPDTSLVHYKGESTRRSTLDRVELFYQAMVVFARKHHGHSGLFLGLLRLGIGLRALLARANRHRRSLAFLALDLAGVNGALLVATRLRFGSWLGFPAYAYPDVFVAVSTVTVLSMLAAGEYFESRPSVRRAFAGLMIAFFALTTITHFARRYAFSRGVLLMTVSLAIVASTLVRALGAVYDRSLGRAGDRRVLLVGTGETAARLIAALQSPQALNAVVVGAVSSGGGGAAAVAGAPVLGTLADLPDLVEAHRVHEVVVADEGLSKGEVLGLIAASSRLSVRFHVAHDYDEVIAARILDDVAGIEPTVPDYAILRLRYRLAKRLLDLAGALFLVTLGLPAVALLARDFARTLGDLGSVLRGRASLIGLYPLPGETPRAGKVGLTGLAHISSPERLSPHVIADLNDYYAQRYSLSLDFDIAVKALFRRVSG